MPRLDYRRWGGREPVNVELDDHEREALSDAALWMYNRLRARKRKPLSRHEAYQCALAKTHNDDEEGERHLSHGTGAT
jgi:hypothetical protein